jgi:methyltransferase (TIGR00027 family)
MLILRAIEQYLPESRRIIDDPYAAQLLINSQYRMIAASSVLSQMLSGFLKFWAPGGQEMLTIRPRLVDDYARELAAKGLDQIVLLGAGFDTMALRLKNELRGCRIFEVDHPATQAEKVKGMNRIGKPGNLVFVAVDFEKDDFVEQLKGAGFDPALRTFIVWVGVSYYLRPQTVEQSLSRIAALGGPGTRLAWDYMLADVVDGSSKNLDALDKRWRVAALGEPWLFGLKPEDIPGYLDRFGFRLIRDYESLELQQLYCPDRRRPMSYVRIAFCERI